MPTSDDLLNASHEPGFAEAPARMTIRSPLSAAATRWAMAKSAKVRNGSGANSETEAAIAPKQALARCGRRLGIELESASCRLTAEAAIAGG